MLPKDLLAHDLWWDVPSWLLTDPVQIPWKPPRRPLSVPEQRVISVNILQAAPPVLLEGRYSNFHQLISITARCLRFYHKLRHKQPAEAGPRGRHLTAPELVRAEHWLVRLSQARSFPRERQALLQGRSISPSSKLISLSPFLDQEQLIRVGGRLSNSALTLSQKHPLIADSKDTLITLLFTYMHICLGHCGPTLLLSAVGWRYHVVGARRLCAVSAESAGGQHHVPNLSCLESCPRRGSPQASPSTKWGWILLAPSRLRRGTQEGQCISKPTFASSSASLPEPSTLRLCQTSPHQPSLQGW